MALRTRVQAGAAASRELQVDDKSRNADANRVDDHACPATARNNKANVQEGACLGARPQALQYHYQSALLRADLHRGYAQLEHDKEGVFQLNEAQFDPQQALNFICDLFEPKAKSKGINIIFRTRTSLRMPQEECDMGLARYGND
eukprot:CAMPEP_0185590168 /NCGR_PEP_ID=MMETSP0434-20130131/59801_1 /TAXON_ID=626734 ORGANISM="Favella taraikaensis, Strain Fe Narragansett Bay" /NCGR_SAMPLE_ID=MMETSP0434 /ASSEMBLY_ACC=CAM_ASM_000379 /LENGTH=144 /DNA_ID=CAMNT_0028214137 /DNA_START=258 /DNA_END=693 /DNA_ORIENTATION=-